ncbi:MAG: YceD family protein [Proteobacteria bacterium]|nr:YceD family protein [Pseudomonadota bacterium]
MLEKLPRQFDVASLARSAKEIAFRLKGSEFVRLTQATLNEPSVVEGVLRFSLFEGRYPQIEVQVSTEVSLICQRSLEAYQQSLQVTTLLVFADEDATDWLEAHEVLPPEEMDEDPRVWIEDSLLLALPLVPVQPGSQPIEYQVGEVAVVEEVKPNPFAHLKAIMQKE